jgi:hypothetical protein
MAKKDGLISRILAPFRGKETEPTLDEALQDGTWVNRAQELGILAPQQVTPRAMFFDPMSLVSQAGYKEKSTSLTYDVLRSMAERTEVINAIINTRLAQIGAFSQPARWKNKTGLGFQIRFKEAKKKPTKSEEVRLAQLEEMVYNCGYTDRYRSGERRPNFGEFLRRILRDSLIFDQMTFEIIPNRLGEPCEWWPVDAATIRLAQPHIQNFGDVEDGRDIIKYVQIYNNMIRHTFTYREMAFCTRNQDNNIKKNGYGCSELEMLINMVTAILWAEEYNKRFFSQGQMINGVMNLKGQNIPPDMLEAFRRQWQALASSVTNAHKVPLLTVKDGVEFINFHSNNRDMEYNAWIEFLVKITTAVYLIDPAEVNFDYRGASESAPLFESSPEAKLKHSRDKGLRNLLNFVEEKINFHIIHEIDPNLYFEFVGIDMKDEQELVNIRASEVQAYKTINEVREEAGLKKLAAEQGGDMIANSVLVNWQLQQQTMQMQQQQQGAEGAPSGPPGDPKQAVTHAGGFPPDSQFAPAPASGGGAKPPEGQGSVPKVPAPKQG